MRRWTVGEPVVSSTTITQREIEEPVGTERDLAGIVVELRFVDAEQDDPRSRIGQVGVIGRHSVFGEDFAVATTRRADARLPKPPVRGTLYRT